MGITLIYLDSSHETDPSTILVGKDVLIMFKPSPSLTVRNKSIGRLINTPDLLLKTDVLDKLRSLQLWTDEIAEHVGSMIQIRDTMQNVDKGILAQYFGTMQQEIKDRAVQIAKTEDELQLYLAEEHRLYFCGECHAYLGMATDSLPEQCKVCDKKLSKDISKAESMRYLDAEVRNYLQGIWFQDYVGKILTGMGWETWTECSVMGSSGVYHPIDILAIDKNKGRVVVVECKRTALGDHAFKLAARFADIQPSFGLLITLNQLNSEQGRNLLIKKPGLKLLELENHDDKMVEKALSDYISREN